ncbi:hypothetical protein LLEC1_03595 [Akanthomyces lecanii]|uniref:Uncharacterized protein n=1 Tax=Cordyceps confragosa TaxID=2714763 RepID=A0A179I6M3_CORDF|nr:hypothetical protein LLEC1_03595 [Akanthomyces lecanii]
MFKRSFRNNDAMRMDRSARVKKSGSVRDPTKLSKLQRSLTENDALLFPQAVQQQQPPAPSPIVTLTRYGLEELKRLALRKQGLQAGIDVATILRSAQYAYAHTPDSDSRLRAHYLALIIRCRKTFKRSGTMQAEMEAGGTKLFFDLFVAMCNHLDDVIDVNHVRSPRTV